MDKSSESGLNMERILALAQSEAGKKLIALMSRSDGMRQSAEKAASGDYADAKQSLKALLSTPEGQKLYEELKNK